MDDGLTTGIYVEAFSFSLRTDCLTANFVKASRSGLGYENDATFKTFTTAGIMHTKSAKINYLHLPHKR